MPLMVPCKGRPAGCPAKLLLNFHGHRSAHIRVKPAPIGENPRLTEGGTELLSLLQEFAVPNAIKFGPLSGCRCVRISVLVSPGHRGANRDGEILKNEIGNIGFPARRRCRRIGDFGRESAGRGG